jgi:ABC-type uncharacterized transport system involved in gliding motility auxiliary subunit
MKRGNLPQYLHLLAAGLMFLAIGVLTYQIAARHNHRFDFTPERFHSLTPETVEVLGRMKQGDLRIRGFFAEEDPARRQLEILLKGMAVHHPRFHYEILDPDRNPSVAQRFRVTSYRTILIDFEGRRERVAEFTEEALVNAFIRLTHPQKWTLCFTTGHGEMSLADRDRTGLTSWKETLEERQFQLREIQTTGQEIPSECDIAVIAGPHYELVPQEQELLQKYPEKGKGLLLLIDPMDPGAGKSWRRLTQAFGIELGENVVVDKVSRTFGGDYLVPLVSKYADHPVTERFRVVTFLPIARTVKKSPEAPEGIEVTELAFTTPQSWAETNLKKLEEGEAEFDPQKDVQGPLSLAAAAEFKGGSVTGRVVVVGDNDFLTNAYLPLSGNEDLTLNLLEWLARDDRWISIRPRMPRFEPLFLKVPQSVGIAVFAIGGLPLSFLIAGSVGIWRRRKLG